MNASVQSGDQVVVGTPLELDLQCRPNTLLRYREKRLQSCLDFLLDVILEFYGNIMPQLSVHLKPECVCVHYVPKLRY